MAEKSLFWTTGAIGDGATSYTQAEVIRWMRQLWLGDNTDEGVMKNYENELSASGATTPVVVNTGAAVVYGFPYWNTTTVNVTIPTPAGSTRVDLIVLRADWTAQTVRITRIAGTEGAGPPSLTQTDGVLWDLPLWQASITTGGAITLTDQRVFVHPNLEVSTDMLISGFDGDGIKIASGALDIEPADFAGAGLEDDGSDNLRIAAAAAGAGLVGGAGSALAVNPGDGIAISGDTVVTDPDGTTLENSGGKIQIADNGVDDTKAGNRVPQFYRRQGGSASDWSAVGTTTYTPTSVRMQAGSVRWTGGAASSGNVTVTFPVAFSDKPIGLAVENATILLSHHNLTISLNVSATQMIISWVDETGSTQTILDFFWQAIGPE
jgi:hypothetical protein